MTNIRLSSRRQNVVKVAINGVLKSLPVDAVFDADAATLEVLDRANPRIPYDLVLTQGAATGEYMIPSTSGYGGNVPISINGVSRRLPVDTPFTPTASELAALVQSSVAFVTLYATGGGVAIPVNTVLPVISGTPTEGQLLSTTTGTWSNSPTGYTYQWKRSGVAISGATASTYLLVNADVTSLITVSVTASNAGGAGITATSAATSAIAALTITAPVLTQTSATGSTPFMWDTAIPADVYAGYFRRIQTAATSDFAAPTQDILKQITPQEIAGEDAVIPGFTTPSGAQFWLRERFERDNGDSTIVTSAWSNSLTDTIIVATATLNTANGTNKSQFIAVSGTPKLIATGSSGVGAPCGVRATNSAAGKRQFEVTITAIPSGLVYIGVEDGTFAIGPTVFAAPGEGSSTGIVYRSDGDIYRGGTFVQNGTGTLAAGDVVTVVFDTVAGTVSFYRTRSGTTIQLGVTLTGASFTNWFAYVATTQDSVLAVNFGQSAFTRALPSGYSFYG